MTRISRLIILAIVLVFWGGFIFAQPFQMQEAGPAIQKIRDAVQEALTEGGQILNDPKYEAGDRETRENYRRVRARWLNLRAVVRALESAEIKWGDITSGAIAHVNDGVDPPEIEVDMTWIAMPPEVLAHKAKHIIIDVRRNSIDEELLCFQKEAEVWDEIKPEESHVLHRFCNSNSQLMARDDEDYIRQNIRQRHLYRNLPEHAND